MKKWALMMISVMLLCASWACADTLFPSLAPAAPEPADTAPSYGGYANTAPSGTEPYAEGGTVVTYSGVSEQNYADFGEYLAGLGFELKASNVEGRTAEMIIANEKFSIGVVYNADTREMKLIYEEGVEYAKMDYFRGCTRVALGETLKVKGLGNFSFSEFHLRNYDLRRASHYYKGRVVTGMKGTSVALVFDYLNTTNETKNYKSDAFIAKSSGRMMEGSGKVNDLADITLWYINDNDAYTFDSICYGYLSPSRDLLISDDAEDRGVRKMENSVRCASFDLPEAVLNAEDGTLAVVLAFHGTEEKAVIILRENGARTGEWE